MSPRSLIPFLALLLGSATLLLNAQKVKRITVVPTNAASGHEMYNEYCAVCHGADGKGNGPAASALKTAPTDLTTMAPQKNGKYPENRVYNSIKGDVELAAHGSKDMPVWGSVFQELSHSNPSEVQLRISNLTRYVESLQSK